MVSVLFEVAFVTHGATALAVKVRVTDPAVISAALGVYSAFVNELALVKVPVPLDVHVTLEKLEAIAPLVILTGPELEQVTTGLPATAPGVPITVITTSVKAGVQGGLLTVQRSV